MSLSTKILLIVGSIITLGLLSVIVYQQVQISHRQQAIEEQVVAQKQLVDNIMRSQSTYATKDDINSFVKDNGLNLKAIQDDLDKLHSTLTSVNSVKVDSNGVQATNVPSTNTGTKNPSPPATTTVTCDGKELNCPNPDQYGYLQKQELLTLNEPFGNVQVPIGSVGFSAWQKDPWQINILPREYHLTSVIGVDENERQTIYNKVSIKAGDKSYDVEIATAQAQQVYPEAKFSWWNPRLFLGLDGGITVAQFSKAGPIHGEFIPSLNLGIMSYGRYKTTPDFSILELGVGYGTVSQTVQFVLTPVTYNIGKHLPFMNNTYIGPAVAVGTDGGVSVLAGARVGL